MPFTVQQSRIVFPIVCIGLRAVLAYVITANLVSRWIAPLVLISVGIGFTYLYATNGRTNAAEAGGVTWWSQWRLLHGVLWISSGFLYALGFPVLAGGLLWIDVGTGLFLHINHHYLNCKI